MTTLGIWKRAALTLTLAAFALTGFGGRALARTGGPDAGGYTFRDQASGAVYRYVDIRTTGTVIISNVDDTIAPVTLGAPFTFYGAALGLVQVSSNGWIGNATTDSDFTNDCSGTTFPIAPGGGGYRINVYHDDLVSTVRYQYFNTAQAAAAGYPGETGGISVIEWSGTYFPSTITTVDFEAILFHDDNSILTMVGLDNHVSGTSFSGTIGIQNADQSAGLLYMCAPFTTTTTTTTDFEGAGSALPAGYTTSGTIAWSRATGNADTGTRSAVAVATNHNQSGTMTATFTVGAGGGTLSFRESHNTEINFDFLSATDNGTNFLSVSGPSTGSGGTPTAYATVTRALTPGSHTIVWTYSTDVSVIPPNNGAWIDNVTLTENVVSTVPTPLGSSYTPGVTAILYSRTPIGGVCGNGTREAAEQCDDGNTRAGDCCSPTCTFEPATTVCRPGGLTTGVQCDFEETCTGTSGTCPADGFYPATTVCRPSRGGCDAAEFCTGTGAGPIAGCPADVGAAAGTVCRIAATSCDVAETCTGTSTTCPTDAFAAAGTACADRLTCNGAETCNAAGACGATALSCDDSNACTADACAEPGGCSNTVIAGCCTTDAACDDGDPCTTDSCSASTCTNVANSSCVDSGVIDTDAGTIDTDAAVVDTDAGTVDTDAGTIDTDAGTIGTDAGVIGTDSGTPPVDSGVRRDAGTDSGTPAGDGGGTSDAGTTPGVDAGGTVTMPASCACRAASRSTNSAGALALGLGLALVIARRRRR